MGNMMYFYDPQNNGYDKTYAADAFSYGAILFQAASLCDISEVDALKSTSYGASNFL